jgi:hypothetical protein
MRLRLVVPLAVLAGGLPVLPALASWLSVGSGHVVAGAEVLTPPVTVLAVPVAPTSSAVDVTYAPGTNPSPAGYVVVRDKTAAGGPGPVTLTCTTSPCHDTGLTSGVTYTYTVQTVLGAWTAATAPAANATTTAALLVAGHTGNRSGKVRFTGTGAVAAVPLDVAVCSAPVLTCTPTSATYLESVTLTPATPGLWTSPLTSRLTAGSTYVATASQGATVSAPYTFVA